MSTADQSASVRMTLSRRHALRLLTLGAGAGLLTACATVPPTTAPPTSAAPAATAASAPKSTTAPATAAPAVAKSDNPVTGGILSTYADGVPGSFDLHIESSIRTCVPMAPCFNSLLRADETDPNKVVPDLATSWDISNGGRTFTLKLLDGVKFHGGQPFGADDAKFSLDRVRTVKSPYAAWFNPVDAIEAVDKQTLRLQLKAPDSALPLKLASPWIAMYSKTWVEGGKDPKVEVNGTGPFRLEKYTKGSEYRLVKNPEYFRKGRPYVDNFNIFFMEQEAQQANLVSKQMLWTGPASKAVDTPAKQDQVRQAIKGVVLQPYDGLSGSMVLYNLAQKPFDDVRVRRALDLAIDRRGANQALYDGAGSVMGPISVEGFALPTPELEKYGGYRTDVQANRTEAKALLAQVGLGSGFKVPLITFETTHTVNTAVYVKDQWSKIGVDADVQIIDLPTLTSRESKGDFTTSIESIAERLADPSAILGKYIKGDGFNYQGVNDETLAKLYAQLAVETDPAKRIQLGQEMQRQVLDQAYGSVVVGRPSWQGWWPQMKNYHVGIGHYHTYIRMEQVWLAPA